MRLKEINVKKLFGVFDHTIPLNMEDRITIIHGLNGYGKTTILQLVQGAMQAQYSRLRKTPFSELTLKFDDGQELRIQKTGTPEPDQGGGKGIKLVCELRNGGRSVQKDTIDSPDIGLRLGFPSQYISQQIEDLEQITPETWLEVSTGRQLDLEEVIDIYGDFLPIERRKNIKKSPQWLQTLQKSFEVRLIAAQRLLNVAPARRSRTGSAALPLQPAVQLYSQELATRIQQVQAQYGAKSQELDSSFAGRAIKGSASAAIELAELESKLQSLEVKRKGIIEAGLLPADHNVAAIQGAMIEDSVKGILALHASDVEKKLGVFDEIAAKVELLKELVNRRFSFKKLEVERQTGFRLVSDSGATLQPTDLSSGEQHELVLFYELLFRTKSNALILIDEPELSLHIAWQGAFLKDLERIVKLSFLDVVLATHSPQIIDTRWDLTVELGAPSS